ncbi:MAG: ankyrin repeat domain-containing protein [Pseudomonadales bacterium]|nr:ankyrin repeat domain-containing protein [Pseudomonadales bacterium]
MIPKLCKFWLVLIAVLGMSVQAAENGALLFLDTRMADTRLAEAAMARDMITVRSLLLEQGADVNALGPYATPALHWVVRVEDVDTARLLLEAGADPNLANAYKLLPLHLAIENRNLAMVRLLLSAGADPRLPDRTGENSLFLAARSGSADIVKAVLDYGADPDEKEPNFNQTPLMMAIRAEAPGVVRLLLDTDVDVNAQTLSGEVPRMRLPSENAGSKGVGINRGGIPDHGERAPVGGAKTALLYATRQGDLALTRMLVEAGANLEQADANGVTPLINAIVNASVVSRGGPPTGHIATARYLIAQGADVNASDWYGETPLWSAVMIRNLNVAGATRDNKVDRDAALALIKDLIAAGADVNARTRESPPTQRFITRIGDLSWVDFTGQTPFLRAALSGDVTVMKLLVENGADPNLGTFAGTTPLMAAAGINWVVNQTWDEGPEALLEAVQYTHKLGNDVNARNSMGLAAVHGAANRGSDDIIRYLAANGAALEVADKEGRTPLAWAHGVFLATHPPVDRPETAALIEELIEQRRIAQNTGNQRTTNLPR